MGTKNESLLEELPLVFDDTTLKTIRNIDVLWIRKELLFVLLRLKIQLQFILEY